jgi:Flp pilus assembly protein TadG
MGKRATPRSLVGLLARLRVSIAGNILVIAALSMPLFIGAAGMATDTVLWAIWRRELQRSADSAAYAGALTIQQDRYQAEKAARHDFTKSKAFKQLQATMTYENSPSDGPYSSDSSAVRVTVQRPSSLPFSNFFLGRLVYISARATATLADGVRNCLFALEEQDASAISFSGNGSIDITCGAFSNSTSSLAITANGSSTVSIPYVSAVGGVPGSSNYVGAILKSFQGPQLDPLRDLPDPTPPQSKDCKSVTMAYPAYLQPGCYVGMNLNGFVNLAAGVYYVVDADFNVGSTANVSGTGVTIILTSTKNSYPTVNINGNPQINLEAATSGIYKNLLFYQDRAAPALDQNVRKTNFFTGNSSSRLKGDLYFPSQSITFTGNTGLDLGCFKLVARRITVSGNTKMANTCAEDDKRYVARRVRLVG